MTKIYLKETRTLSIDGVHTETFVGDTVHDMNDFTAEVALSAGFGITASDYEAKQAKANAPAKKETTPRKGASSASVEGAPDASA